MSNETLSQKEFGKKIGKTPRTLQRWDKQGLFKARRNPAGNPFYLIEDLERYLSSSITGDNNG